MHPKLAPRESTGEGLTHKMRFWFQTIAAIALRPRLWWTAVRQMFRMTPGRWWARPPFLPVPDRRYMRFRLETAYGTDGPGQAADVVRYLEWCRAQERAS